MTTRVLISFFCDDRPGVTQQLSEAVALCDGNWLDSQLSRLGGRFAGVLQAQVPVDRRSELESALATLAEDGITATLTDAGDAQPRPIAVRRLTLVGPDRPGIVHELTRSLHSAGFNLQSLDTSVESAPMSGELLFRAIARIELLEGGRLDQLEWQLDAMADAMTLDIDLLDDD